MITDKEFQTAALVFAHYLGIDIEKEEDLIEVAEEALDRLPEGWQLGVGEGENAGIPYFYNDVTGESSWHHPEEKKYLKIIKQEKKRRSEEKGTKSPKSSTNQTKVDSNKISNSPRNGEDYNSNNRRNNNSSNSNNNNSNNNSKTNTTLQSSSKQQSLKRQDEDVVEMLDVEDFSEPEPSPTTIVTTKKSSKTNNSKTATQTKNENTTVSAFSMNASDFYDDPVSNIDSSKPSSPESNWNKIKESNRNVDVVNNKAETKVEAKVETKSFSTPALSSSNRDYDDWQGSTRKTNVGVAENSNSNNKSTRYEKNDQVSSSLSKGSNVNTSANINTSINTNASDNRGTSRGRSDRRNDDELIDYEEGMIPLPRNNNSYNKATNNNYTKEYDSNPRISPKSSNKNKSLNSNTNNNNNTNSTTESNASRYISPQKQTIRSTEDSLSTNSTQLKSKQSSKQNYDENNEKYENIVIQKLEFQLNESQEESIGLHKLIKDLRVKHDDEMEALKKYTRRIEDRAAEDRDEKKALQEKLIRIESDNSMKLRELEDSNANKVYEITKKIRAELEEEYKDRVKSIERRQTNELEETQSSLYITKKRYDEALKEIESYKKRIQSSREDGKLEILTELEETKLLLLSSEQQGRQLASELKKVREDYINLSSRCTTLSQQLQISQADSESARISVTSLSNDYQSANTALILATQRIAALDIDIGNLKAENLSLKHENENLIISNRKLQQNSNLTGDRLGVAEMESKRVKNQSINEINRLSSRVIELEAITQQQQLELDKSILLESEAIREIQKQLSKAEYNNTILSDRLQENEKNRQKDLMKTTSLEKELQRMEEIVYKKERQIKEEQIAYQSLKEKYDNLRISHESEITSYINQIRTLSEEKNELESKHRMTIESIQLEVTNRLPLLVSSAMQSIESKWNHKLAIELNDCKTQCEVTLEEKYRGRIQELQTIASDREAKVHRMLLEERSEVERLRGLSKALKNRIAELEEELERIGYMYTQQERKLHRKESINRSGGQLNGQKMRNSMETPLIPSMRQSFGQTNRHLMRESIGTSERIVEPYFSNQQEATEEEEMDVEEVEEESHQQDMRPQDSIFQDEEKSSVHLDTSHNSNQNISYTNQPPATNDATSFVIQSQLDSMRQQLGKYLSDPIPSNVIPKTPSYTIPKTLSKPMLSPEPLFISPQMNGNTNHRNRSRSSGSGNNSNSNRSRNSLSMSYEIPSSLMKPLSSYTSNNNISNRTNSIEQNYHELDDFDRNNESFEAIEDGGYHQGYWKAKYSPSSSLNIS